jgi:hypothetical protein
MHFMPHEEGKIRQATDKIQSLPLKMSTHEPRAYNFPNILIIKQIKRLRPGKTGPTFTPVEK